MTAVLQWQLWSTRATSLASVETYLSTSTLLQASYLLGKSDD